MPDQDTCSAELASALPDSAPATRTVLLEILSDVGGSTALQTLAKAVAGNDRGQQDTASRLLGKWNSLDAAPVLLDLAKSDAENKYRVRGLRGYLGLARKFARGFYRLSARSLPEETFTFNKHAGEIEQGNKTQNEGCHAFSK